MLETYDSALRVDAIPLEFFKGGSDVIVASKTCAKVPGAEKFFRRESRRKTTILYDLVDGNPRSTRKLDSYISGFICSSPSEFAFRQEENQPAFMVHHHVDQRLHATRSTTSEFSVGYAGAPYNSRHLEQISIDVFDTSLLREDPGLVRLSAFLDTHSHHYSVREPEKRKIFKPSLKAFIASFYSKAFIGSREDDESLAVLGDDYPYLSRSSSLSDVTEIIEYARETFLTDIHSEALAKMDEIRPLYCPASVVESLHSAIALSILPSQKLSNG